MNSFGRSAPRGRRAAPRTKAPLVVELSTDGARQSGVLAEISRTGAKLTGVHAPAVGQDVLFRAGAVQVPGQIVWSEGDQCAVAFDIPLAAGEVSRLRSLASFVTSVGGR